MNFIKLGNSLNSAIGINFGIFSVARIPRVTGCAAICFSVSMCILRRIPYIKKLEKIKDVSIKRNLNFLLIASERSIHLSRLQAISLFDASFLLASYLYCSSKLQKNSQYLFCGIFVIFPLILSLLF